MFEILSKKGFKPYLLIAFLNIAILFGHLTLVQECLYYMTGVAQDTKMLIGIVALMSLPFILFFAYAGYLADRWGKANVIRYSAWALFPITVWIVICDSMGWFWLSYASTFLLATQRAISSPARYGYIRQAYGKSNIAQGIAWLHVSMGFAIFVAVYGMIGGYKLMVGGFDFNSVQLSYSLVLKLAHPLSYVLIICSIAIVALTFRLDSVEEDKDDLRFNAIRSLSLESVKGYFSLLKGSNFSMISIYALASFWATSQILLICYPGYIDHYVVGATLSFSRNLIGYGLIGVILGAVYAGKSSARFIEVGYLPLAAIMLTVCLFLFPILQGHSAIVITSIVYAFFGGLLVVPLNAVIQFGAESSSVGRIISIANLVQNLAIIVGIIVSVLLLQIGLDSIYLLRAIFLIAAVVSIVALYSVPQGLVRYLLYFVVSKFYRLDVLGLENVPSQTGALLLGNHTSYLDWAIIQIVCPRRIRFVMERSIYEKWYIKMILQAFRVIPVSKSGAKQSLKAVEDALNNDELVVMFPEGYLSRNGQIGKFHAGFERVMTEVNVPIIPFYLRGLWGSVASHATKQYKTSSKIKTRQVSVSFGPPLPSNSNAAEVKKKVFELSIVSWRAYTGSMTTVPRVWLQSAKRMGNELCVVDSTGIKLSYHQFIVAVWATARRLKAIVKDQNNLGIILPTSAGGAVANMSAFCLGKTVVNLNYTAGIDAMQMAIEKAEIKTIVTSRLFCKKLIDRGIDLESIFEKVECVYLEDLKKKNNKSLLLVLLLSVQLLPSFILSLLFIKRVPQHSTAAIMFSSGSEGSPKGVELTHYNLLANIKQVSSISNLEDSDTIMSMLPLFHCFGLTVSTLLPLIEGSTFVCHPDPTDTKSIGRMVFRYQATLLFGSSTFFGLYARSKKLHPLMFSSLRLVIAGAEKLSSQVRQIFKEKFNIDVLEGYGTTEVAPVASCNMPDMLNPDDMHLHVSNKLGSVGLPLPGSAFRIVDPHTHEELATGEAGMIVIGGPQVMKGYLHDEDKTKAVLLADDNMNWYITGDKGYLDEDGYLFIVDRYSRFAKVGGEMVSLSVVEHKIHDVIDETDSELMAITVPDDRKGERIVILYRASVAEDELKQRVASTITEKLMIPSVYIKLDELPKMGSGKSDYVSAKKIGIEILSKK